MIYDFDNGKDSTLPYLSASNFRSDVEQEEPLSQLHNPKSKDISLAEKLSREAIRTSGAHVMVYVRTNNSDHDDVWDEDSDPTYFNAIQMKAYFKPEPTELELKKWGLESENKTEVVFAMSDVQQNWPNRLIRAGDVIELPYNHPVAELDPGFYRVINASPSGNYRYHWLYLNCTVSTLTADITVRVVNDMPNEDV